MARKTVSELQSKFETGDVPTAGDFRDLIDSTYNATSGLKETNGFANLSCISLSVNEFFIQNLEGSTQDLTLTTPTGIATLTITNGIITNVS